MFAPVCALADEKVCACATFRHVNRVPKIIFTGHAKNCIAGSGIDQKRANRARVIRFRRDASRRESARAASDLRKNYGATLRVTRAS